MMVSRLCSGLIATLHRRIRQSILLEGCQKNVACGSAVRVPIRGFCSRASPEQDATLHFCVVGSGPAGFYTADRILRQYANAVRVDILDQLPTPFGLVRSGVAPDHPETKVQHRPTVAWLLHQNLLDCTPVHCCLKYVWPQNVEHQFTEVARNPQTTFLGNIRVGTDVQLIELRDLYSGVVLAYGSESDRKLSIPGEEAAGVLPARRFVWWYNGHPAGAEEHIDLSKVRSVAILGIGNVALDCARLLMSSPTRLERTDIAERALQQLRNSGVEEVHVIARRGPAQAACTPKELREIMEVASTNVHFNAMDAIQQPAEPITKSQTAPERIQKRLLSIFSKAAKAADPQPGSRQLHFHFMRSPLEFVNGSSGNVEHVQTALTALHTSPEGLVITQPTGEQENIAADLVLVSIGYKAVPIPGVAFDTAAGVIQNRGGRVLDQGGEVMQGVYACGWLSRGASGIIGTNLHNALQVATTIGEDTSQLKIVGNGASPTSALKNLLDARSVRYTTFANWETINSTELEAGRRSGKLREKLATMTDLLAATDSTINPNGS